MAVSQTSMQKKLSFLFYLIIINKTEYLSNQVYALIGSEWHEKWQVHGDVYGMNNQKSLVILAKYNTPTVGEDRSPQAMIFTFLDLWPKREHLNRKGPQPKSVLLCNTIRHNNRSENRQLMISITTHKSGRRKKTKVSDEGRRRDNIHITFPFTLPVKIWIGHAK